MSNDVPTGFVSPNKKLQRLPTQNRFDLDGVVFSSQFDNGNLSRVMKLSGTGHPYDYKVFVATDNYGTSYASKHNAWFYFSVTGLPKGVSIRITIGNASNHAALYRQDMRPVYKSNGSGQKWQRLRGYVNFSKAEDSSCPQMTFEHLEDVSDDLLYFAFTFPYTYGMVQEDMAMVDAQGLSTNFNDPDSVYCTRELLTKSCDGLRVDLVTITSCKGVSHDREREPRLLGLFPIDTTNTNTTVQSTGSEPSSSSPIKGGESSSSSGMALPDPRPFVFPDKEVVFVSARVHPGDIPSLHTPCNI